MFTDGQKIWIDFEHGKEQSPAMLKRKFLIKYGIKGRKATLYQAHLFTRVVVQFQKKGISKGKIAGRPSSETTPAAKV